MNDSFSVSHVLMTNRMTNNLEPTRFQYQNITYGDSAIPIGKSKYFFLISYSYQRVLVSFGLFSDRKLLHHYQFFIRLYSWRLGQCKPFPALTSIEVFLSPDLVRSGKFQSNNHWRWTEESNHLVIWQCYWLRPTRLLFYWSAPVKDSCFCIETRFIVSYLWQFWSSQNYLLWLPGQWCIHLIVLCPMVCSRSRVVSLLSLMLSYANFQLRQHVHLA